MNDFLISRFPLYVFMYSLVPVDLACVLRNVVKITRWKKLMEYEFYFYKKKLCQLQISKQLKVAG